MLGNKSHDWKRGGRLVLLKLNILKLIVFRISFCLSLLSTVFSCYLLTDTKKVQIKPKPILDSATTPYRAYWVGHATVLLKFNDIWILTDPIWNDNLLYTFGRHREPGIEITDLPPIDIVIVSHVHLDHLDTYTLKKISKNAHLILPKGAPSFDSYGFKKVSYVRNGDTIEFGKTQVVSVPAQHFGGRWAIDNFWDGEPYTGYVITNGLVSVYFAGDTGYNTKDFKEIGAKYKIDLALIPFGPYRGKLFGSDLGNTVHVSPKGAMQILRDVNAKKMIPIHHGTFYANPIKEIVYVKDAIQESDLKERVFLMEQGQSITFAP